MTATQYQDVTVLGYRKRGETYLFVFDEKHRRDVLQTLGRWASDADMRFTWYDAAVVAKRVRGETE